MAANTVKDVDELQRRLIDQFQRFMQAPQPGAAARPSAPPPPADLPALVSAAWANLEAAMRQRDEIVRHADLRVERRKQQLATLQAELKRLQDQVAPSSAPAPAPEKAKGKRR